MFSTMFIVSELFGRSSDIQKILSITEEARLRKSENKPAENARRKTFSRTDAMEIEKTKLFGITESAPSTSKETDTPAPAKKLEPLNLALIGIFYNKSGGSSAIIEDKKKMVQDVFQEGQSVFDIATVSSIQPGQVEVKYAGGTEVLVIEDLPTDSAPAAVVPADAEEVIVQEDELNSALDNLPLLLTQARAVPYFKDGQAVGLRLFAIKSGSMFEKIGLKNGDILKNINGNNLGDFSQAMKLFEQLREERNLTLELERNRKPQTFFYKIR
jgi:general secretion pathway protein C